MLCRSLITNSDVLSKGILFIVKGIEIGNEFHFTHSKLVLMAMVVYTIVTYRNTACGAATQTEINAYTTKGVMHRLTTE